MTGERDDYDPLVVTVGDCRPMLIGEASRGTHEFYRERAAMTRRLMQFSEDPQRYGYATEVRLSDSCESDYFTARLPGQFDAILHIDSTRAVEPLERTSLWERGEVAETFPSGF